MLGCVYFIVNFDSSERVFMEPPVHVFRRYALLNVLDNSELEFDPHQTASSLFSVVTAA
jgi:hypothetical protein